MLTELIMTLREADRLSVVKRIANKELSISSGARELGMSSRQMKRVWRRYREEGTLGLVSRRRGKPSPNRRPEKLRKRAMNMIREKYTDYGPTLASEKMREKHSLIV